MLFNRLGRDFFLFPFPGCWGSGVGFIFGWAYGFCRALCVVHMSSVSEMWGSGLPVREVSLCGSVVAFLGEAGFREYDPVKGRPGLVFVRVFLWGFSRALAWYSRFRDSKRCGSIPSDPLFMWPVVFFCSCVPWYV